MQLPRLHFLTIPELAQRWGVETDTIISYITTRQLEVYAFVTVEDVGRDRTFTKLRSICPKTDREGHLFRYIVQREPFSVELDGDHRDGPDQPWWSGQRILRYSGKIEDVRVLMTEVERFEAAMAPESEGAISPKTQPPPLQTDEATVVASANWSDVELILRGNNTVDVKVKGEVIKRSSFREFGIEDRRTGAVNQIGKLLADLAGGTRASKDKKRRFPVCVFFCAKI